MEAVGGTGETRERVGADGLCQRIEEELARASRHHRIAGGTGARHTASEMGSEALENRIEHRIACEWIDAAHHAGAGATDRFAEGGIVDQGRAKTESVVALVPERGLEPGARKIEHGVSE